MVRRRLGRRLDTGREAALERLDGFARRQVHQMDGSRLRGRKREVALDHDALGARRIGADSELRGNGSLVHVATAGQARLLAVQREPKVGERAVLQRAAHQPRRHHGLAVVRESRSAVRGELGHLRQLLPALPLADRGHEADGDDRRLPRPLDQRAENGRGVDHGLRVRHREERAVPAGGGRLRPRADGLLVLAARSAQVDVRVDEGRRDHQRPRPPRLDRADDSFGDGDPKRFVNSLRRCENAALEGQRVRAPVSGDEHQATSARSRVGTGVGAAVNTS